MTTTITINETYDYDLMAYVAVTVYAPASALDRVREVMEMNNVEDPMTVAHAVKAGLEALGTRGWCQGTLLDPVSGEVCAVGAVIVGVHPGIARDDLAAMMIALDAGAASIPIAALAATLGYASDAPSVNTSQVTSWNDVRSHWESPSRKLHEVEDLFRQTIAILEVL
jgi:hypothetical protein